METRINMKAREEFNQNDPRILVVSNNPFSETENNGKTLASFFDKYPSEKIAQLYFHPSQPTVNRYKNYFRISDNDMLRVCINKNKKIEGKVQAVDDSINSLNYNNKFKNLRSLVKDNNLARLIREHLWTKKKWQMPALKRWLDEFSPQIIFFCAGDSLFTYDIVNFIKKSYKTKLVVYITDDYVLPRKKTSVFEYIKRKILFKKMYEVISDSNLFITISPEMQKKYKTLFNKDSFLAINMTESMKLNYFENNSESKILIYTGGLHYKRYRTLNRLGLAISNYNKLSKEKVFLKIFSNSEPSKKVLKMLNVKGASKFYGSLNQSQLKIELNNSDYPVHVESFDRKSIESTLLSISTKIPEYFSLGKPILAIGPEEVASMKYLSENAFCITNINEVEKQLTKFLTDTKLQRKLSHNALTMYEAFHKKEKVSGDLLYQIRMLSQN